MRLLACGLALMALRMATTSVYYAKNYPSMDLLLNGTRLILVVAGIAATARFGLVGVSASVGAVEGIISLAGQYAVCLITGLHFSKALSAIVPSLNVTAACGLAALLGDAIAVIAGLHGLPAMACLALATGIAFLWLEGAQLKEMFANTFAPVGVHSLETPID
jgi:O-antigen/teichoic acid export membrane protein